MLLSLETCFGKFSIALFKGRDCLAYFESNEATKQAEELVPAIEKLLKDNNITYQDLKQIAVAIGPGSFTGLRIGLAAAIGFGTALPELKVIGVSTLHASAIKKGSYPVYLDAKRGEAYCQQTPTSEPLLIPYTGEFDQIPTAREIALASFEHGQSAQPLYIRKPDAKLPAEVAAYKKMAAIHASCFEEAWQDKDFHAYDYLIEDEGFVAYKCVLDECEIKMICTAPNARRQGLAARLMQRLITAQKDNKLFLEVEETNEAAVNLYKKLGFTEFGRRQNYYGAGRGALLMQLAN